MDSVDIYRGKLQTNLQGRYNTVLASAVTTTTAIDLNALFTAIPNMTVSAKVLCGGTIPTVRQSNLFMMCDVCDW
jgi:hypothetical protein